MLIFVESSALPGQFYSICCSFQICRDMAYHAPSCDLFIGGSTPIAYRVNLHLGQHLAPLETSLVCFVTTSFFRSEFSNNFH
jgi:hypothetical protein